jgi:hypothetical protein
MTDTRRVKMVRLNVRVPDNVWRQLRDVAELDRIRTGGRASVRAVVEKFIMEAISQQEQRS